jgi:hypothetical protein
VTISYIPAHLRHRPTRQSLNGAARRPHPTWAIRQMGLTDKKSPRQCCCANVRGRSHRPWRYGHIASAQY